jgi:hypothetical protein
MGLVTWASALLQLVPAREQPYFVGSADLTKLLGAVHWLVRLRLGDELLILNRNDVAALVTDDGRSATALAAQLPQWILFLNLTAYDYLPDMRIEGLIEDTRELMQRLGLKTAQNLGGVSAGQFLEAIRRPSTEPY